MRRALILLFSLIAGHAMAFDTAKAPRYPSPDYYKPNVSDLTVNGVTATGDVPGSLVARFSAMPLPASDYGVKCDGIKDDAADINRALAAARTRLNKDVLLPARTCAIGQTLTVPDWSNIHLRGAGRGALPGAVPGAQSAAQDATILKWIGAPGGVMIDTQSPAANRPYLTASMQISDLVVDGNGIAGTGIYTRGLVNSNFRVKVRNITSKCWDLDIYNGGGADVQGNNIDFQGDLDYDASTNADCLVIGPGSSYNNVHHNKFWTVRIITRNGTGWKIGNADSNSGGDIQINYPFQAGGNIYTGIGMDFLAAPNALGPGGVTQAARSNVFFGVSNVAPTYARAGLYNLPSYGNVMYGYIQDSNEPNPVVEAGASLDWYSVLGGAHIASLWPGQQFWKPVGSNPTVTIYDANGAILGYIGTKGIFATLSDDKLKIRDDKGGGFGAGNSPAMEWDNNNRIYFQGLGFAANDSAAATAGVPLNAVYFNTTSNALTLRRN